MNTFNNIHKKNTNHLKKNPNTPTRMNHQRKKKNNKKFNNTMTDLLIYILKVYSLVRT